jgi:hypothetical protein
VRRGVRDRSHDQGVIKPGFTSEVGPA